MDNKMIQYKYFHTARGYVASYSIGRDNADYNYAKAIFEKARTSTPAGGFTYATLNNGSSLFLQACIMERNTFADGMLCADFKGYPVKYVDEFDKYIDDPDTVGEVLPGVPQLPFVNQGAPGFPISAAVHKLIPAILDALLFGDKSKQILIIPSPDAEGIDFVAALSALLPASYMSTVGFSLGNTSGPGGAWTVNLPNGTTETLGVKLYIPNPANVRYESYAASSMYYAFDAKSGSSNYTPSKNSITKLVKDLDLTDPSAVSELRKSMESAFDADGNILQDVIETIAAIHMMELNGDINAAKSVLNSKLLTTSLQKNAMMKAIKILLDSYDDADLTAESVNTLFDICISNKEIGDANIGGLINYISSNQDTYNRLNEVNRSFCISTVASDSSGTYLERILKSWWATSRGDIGVTITDAFSFTCEVLTLPFTKNNDNVSLRALSPTIAKAVKFFGIDIDREASDQTKSRLFEKALSLSNQNAKLYALAILMAPAYTSNASRALANARVTFFRDLLSGLHHKDQLTTVIKVREKLIDISNEEESTKLGLDSAAIREAFIFNTDVGLTWMESIIASHKNIQLNQRERISIYALINTVYSRDNVSVRDYTKLKDFVKKTLLDVNYVKQTLSYNNTEDWDVYRQFISKNSSSASDELRKLLEDMTTTIDITRNVRSYRSTHEDEKAKKLNVPRSTNEAKKAEKAKNEKVKKEKKRKMKNVASNAKDVCDEPIVLFACLFAVASIILSLLPALVQAMSSGDVGRFLDYLSRYASIGSIAIPLAAALISIIVYEIFRSRGRMKRSLVITTLVGILPVVVFDIVYLLLYFFGFFS